MIAKWGQDICSKGHLFESPKSRTNVRSNKCPPTFWQFFQSSDRSNWPIETADHSLASLLQINKDGIGSKSQLERELRERLCIKSHLILD